MSKFSSKPVRANTRSALATTPVRARTYEGHLGYERDAKSELFLLAAANMVGEQTFYEGAGERDDRFKKLVWACATTDPAWTAAFIPYLRDTMQMRSASTVAAAHYVASGAPNGRQFVAATLKRPDEAAEILAYYAQEYGRQFPQPLKRGVADAVRVLSMAVLRNLRNFEQAGVSESVLAAVTAKLGDPEEVARSRQFPLRFLSAFKNIETERFAWPLSQALEHSVSNIPRFSGRTLVLIDVSGSMHDRLSQRSELERWEAAALFGVALAKRCDNADTIAYQSQAWKIDTSQSTLRTVSEIGGLVGGGTLTMQTLQAAYAGHDRVVILTDEQAHRGPSVQIDAPVYTFNLGGYRTAHMEQGEKGSYVFGGLTDAGFRMLALLDGQRSQTWPFAVSA